MSQKERVEKFVIRLKPSQRQIREEKALASGVNLSEYLRCDSFRVKLGIREVVTLLLSLTLRFKGVTVN